MNYVDVARNISEGKGIVQSTLGFNQTEFSTESLIPSPFVAQPPLYPLLIALLSRTGIAHTDSALILSAVCMLGVVALAFILTRQMYSLGLACLVAGCLVTYFPLRFVGRYAWSETLAIALAMCTLACLYSSARRQHVHSLLLAGGLVAGLAFSTRYVFAILLPVGLFFIACSVQTRTRSETRWNALAYSIGWAIPVSLVLTHNFSSSRTLLPSMLPSQSNLAENLQLAAVGTIGHWLGLTRVREQVLLAVVVPLVCIARLIRIQRLQAVLQEVFVSRGRYLLWSWAVSYFVLLIVQRTTRHFDSIDTRLVSPAGVALLIPASAFIMKGLNLKVAPHFGIACALFLVLLSSAREAQRALRVAPVELQTIIGQSARLSWVQMHTTDSDLIIGDNTVDIPFYLCRDAAVSFSAYPYTRKLTYGEFNGYAYANRHRFRNFYVVVRRENASYSDLIARYGPFVADLKREDMHRYSHLFIMALLSDSVVYRFVP